MAASANPPESSFAMLARAPLSRRVVFWSFAALVCLGVAFYVYWGLLYGGWLDNGVYAVTIVLVLFGLAGMWLMLPNPPSTAPSGAG